MKVITLVVFGLLAPATYADTPFVYPAHIPPEMRGTFYEEWQSVNSVLHERYLFFRDGISALSSDATKLDPTTLSRYYRRGLIFLPEVLVYLKVSLTSQVQFNDKVLSEQFKSFTEEERATLSHMRMLDEKQYQKFAKSMALILFQDTQLGEHRKYPYISKIGLNDFYELAHNPELPRFRLGIVNVLIQENLGYGFRVRLEGLLETQKDKLINISPGAENRIATETVDESWPDLMLIPPAEPQIDEPASSGETKSPEAEIK